MLNQPEPGAAGQGAACQAAAGFDLECLGVSRRFGEFLAVDNVSFAVGKGSFFSILGPSGCGKTSLLRMLAGFSQPDVGDIRIKQQSVVHLPPNKRPCNMVFQHLALFPNMTVAENIAYGLKRRGVGRSEREARVNSFLQRIGLPDAGPRRVAQLSGGQKQRVAIARCLVLEPAVLLLDEPLGALDLKLREHMKVELKTLQEKFGTTFVYITHDQSEALVMSDQVAVMNHGRFEQVGSPRELYDHPSTAFVAGFVGESNVLGARLEAHTAAGVTLVTDRGLRLLLPSALVNQGLLTSPSTGQSAWRVFLRPEAITLQRGPHALVSQMPVHGGFAEKPVGVAERFAAQARISVGGELDTVLFDGARSQVSVRLQASGDMLNVLVPHTQNLADCRKGQPVTLSWQAGDCRVFRVS